jgi:chemotaxis regulatin CheY-phosphate phosphatase CheZ
MSGVGPMVPGVDTGGGAVSDQDEVDDLLSSLGF